MGAWRATARVLLVTAIAFAAAGCFAVGGSAASVSCAGLPGGACNEQLERLQWRHPGAVSIEMRCAVPVCDRRAGQGTTVITMRDGTRVNDTFAYVGDPNPLPAPVCANVAIQACRSVATSWTDDVPPGLRIIAIQVTCTAARCTRDEGTASVTVTLASGEQRSGETSWSGGLP